MLTVSFFTPLVQVHSQTLYSDFINGDSRVGLVTQTGGTLIAHGVTTVHVTRVVGTVLRDGNYAQVIELKSEVFEEDEANRIRPTPSAGGFGTVVPVTERPSFAVGVAGPNEVAAPQHQPGVGSVQLVRDSRPEPSSPSGVKSRLPGGAASGKKTAAIDDFRQRLKNRSETNKKLYSR